MSKLQVVIGGGTVGSRLAKLLAADGRQVVMIVQNVSSPDLTPGVNLRAADARVTESLLAAAPEAAVIYNCVNPPYDKWEVEWPKLSKAVNDYAINTGADLVICSNLYGYGPHTGVMTEDLPLNATWVNGKARARVWSEAKALHDAGQLRVTEVRGSDYICANEQSRMGNRVVPNLMLGKPVQLLGSLDQPHTWTYPEDVARLMMALAESEKSWGRAWHVPSSEPKTQRQVVADIAKELGVSDYRLSSVPPLIEKVLGLFNPMMKELVRANYQFNGPFVMSSDAATKTFGVVATAWSRVIADLVRPYVAYEREYGKQALAKLGSKRPPLAA